MKNTMLLSYFNFGCYKLYDLLTALSPKASKTKPDDDDELFIAYFCYFVICLYNYKID